MADRLGPINPGGFVGNNAPIVEPRAITAMSDALRQGIITADEIAERARMRPLREQQVKEAVDPVLVQARKDSAVAGASSAKTQAEAQKLALQQAQMKANIPPIILQQNEELAKQNMQVFPETGGLWTPEKSAEVARLWKDLKFWEAEFSSAVAQDKSIKDQDITTAEGVFKVPVEEGSMRQADPAQVGQLKDWIRTNQNPRLWLTQGKPPSPSLFGAAPGAVAQSPAAPAPVPVPQTAPQTPAVPGLVPTIPINEAPPTPLVTPRSPAPTQQPSVTAPGVVPPSTAPRGLKVKDATIDRKAPTEGQTKAGMAVARFLTADEVFKNLESAGFDPGSTQNWAQDLLIGPLASLRTADRRSYDAAKSAWSQGLLRMESGAAIAAKEQSWYEKTFFPTGLEPKAVQDQKAKMRADVEKIAAEIARGGHLDVPALLGVRERAEMVDSLSGAGGAAQQEQTTVGGKTYNVDRSSGQVRLIPVSVGATSAPTVAPYTPPERLGSTNSVTVEPRRRR